MNLGILYKNGKIINHRSLLKVLINPILRRYGYYIGTICIDNEIKGIKLLKGQKVNKISWSFSSTNEYDEIVKKRLIY
jgi:hypothetical protein